MEESKNQTSVKFKLPIVILIFISIACAFLIWCTRIISEIKSFVDDYPHYSEDFKDLFSVSFISKIIATTIQMIVLLAPCILLLIYVLRFYERNKAKVLVPITFGIVAVFSSAYFMYSQVYWTVSSIIDSIFFCENIPEAFENFAAMLPFGFPDTPMLINISSFGVFVLFALATLDSLKGLSKKIIIIGACLAGFLTCLFYTFMTLDSLRYSAFYLFMYIAPLALYAALLLFGLNNEIPVIMVRKKKNVEKMSPEQALKALNKDLELGVITEEEYSAKRAEIIAKL